MAQNGLRAHLLYVTLIYEESESQTSWEGKGHSVLGTERCPGKELCELLDLKESKVNPSVYREYLK